MREKCIRVAMMITCDILIAKVTRNGSLSHQVMDPDTRQDEERRQFLAK